MSISASRVLTPPEALTPRRSPTVFLMMLITSVVAPEAANPVEVFTKSAPAASVSSQALITRYSVHRHVSRITLISALGLVLLAALTTWAMSS